MFYETAEFWAGAAFVLVLLVLFRPVKKVLLSMLDARISSIVKKIDDAEALKIEARRLLVEYEKKAENVEAEVAGILQKSKQEIMLFRDRSLKDIANQIQNRERDIDEKIKNIEERVQNEMIETVSAKSVDGLKNIIADRLSGQEKSALIDSSIDLVGRLSKRA